MTTRTQIKRRREQLGLTQGQVARRIGMKRPSYANLENGHRNIKPHLVVIRRALRMSGAR